MAQNRTLDPDSLRISSFETQPQAYAEPSESPITAICSFPWCEPSYGTDPMDRVD